MRDFFLGNEKLTSCGTTIGANPTKGFAYCCQSCGKLWGRVLLDSSEWFFVSYPCIDCEGYPGQTPGSFLQPLIWWDQFNGNTLTKQLANASPDLIRYEAKVRAVKWLKENR